MMGTFTKTKNSILYNFIITGTMLFLATIIGFLFKKLEFSETNIVIIYLLFILLIAQFTDGYYYGILAAFLATCTFNYFFTEPLYRLYVHNPNYYTTMLIMTIIAIISSAITSKVKQSALEAKEKTDEITALYILTNKLINSCDILDMASITTATISEIFSCKAAFLPFDENGKLANTFIQQKDLDQQVMRKTDDFSLHKYSNKTLLKEVYIEKEFYDLPIYSKDKVYGLLRLPVEVASNMNDNKKRFLLSMLKSSSFAMDSLHSRQQEIKSREEIIKERYRANLLRSISHDLRTPLSAIMGTSEMLMSMTEKRDDRYNLIENIYKDANWLHSLVENILSLTRLRDGNFKLNKQVEAVEEIIQSAVAYIARRAAEYDIIVNIPDEPVFVAMDARLIVQVLINLLDNAIKNSLDSKEITITVTKDSHQVLFSVADKGKGIMEDEIPMIFTLFYTSSSNQVDSQRGIGLGLSICKTIVKAHGGTITAQNRKDSKGAEFIFSLPMEE